MYARQQFREERQEVLVAAMRDVGFATLIALGEPNGEAVHIPMIVRERNERVALEGHVSIANPFWKTAAKATRALAIFSGPHAYVSPRWLEADRDTGRVVPTWAYVAVHARGMLSLNKDRNWLLAHVDALATINEQGRTNPWSVADAPEEYVESLLDGIVESLLDGIVGLRLEVDELEGVWKMLQHRPAVDRLAVIANLSVSEWAGDKAMAAAMMDHEAKHADHD